MPSRRGVPIALPFVFAAALAACSGGPAATTSPISSAAPATGVPSEVASLVPSTPSETAAADLTKWEAFQAQAQAYTKISSDVTDLTSLLTSGDTAGAKATETKMKTMSDALVAWLDANPPDECYRPSWEPLRAAAVLISTGASGYLAGDVQAGSDGLFAGGDKLIDAAGTIMDSGDRCRAAG